MTLTIQWWYFPIILFIAPFIYMLFRKSQGDYDFQIDTMIILGISWGIAVGIIIGALF